jgi:SAM-dependent methyltransferase
MAAVTVPAMPSLLQTVLATGPVRKAAVTVSNWVDLQWSLLWGQLEAIAPRARGKLLDVGCGDKPYERLFRPFVSEYVGIEYGDTFAATNTSSHGTKPDLFYDGKTLPFPSGSFDTVLSVQVFEHTPRPQALLNEMARVCRPDGIVIVSAPFSFRLHEEPNDFFRYTPHGLRAMFDAAGLTLDEVHGQGDIWSVIGHKLNSFLGFRLARIDAIAQAMGKLGHEGERRASPRYWTFPVVLPAMLAVSGASRLLDRIAPDGTESLSYLVVGRPTTRRS